jgi:adenylylsulfate kinase-like enzyme
MNHFEQAYQTIKDLQAKAQSRKSNFVFLLTAVSAAGKNTF